MPKSKRLLDLMLTVNRKRKFTVKELAEEYGVSTRTILRDLQELGELGVPLYSEVGPHGGYRLLNERLLPPIAFTEDEAVAVFFASHALRHYSHLPFEAEASSALEKFYHNMPADIRERIDRLRDRVDFVTPARSSEFPYLQLLLDGALNGQVIRIEYASSGGTSSRCIQPVGIYASSGLWYCPAYCFLRGELRLFRCDRIRRAEPAGSEPAPVDLSGVHLGNWDEASGSSREFLHCHAELDRDAVRVCEAELGRRTPVHIRPDGSGWIKGRIPKDDLGYFAHLFIRLGDGATVYEPAELREAIRSRLERLLERYSSL